MNYGCCVWLILPFVAFGDAGAPTAASSGPPQCEIQPLSSEQHVISAGADGARGISVGDLDGDLDLDILSASDFDDKIAWYENDGATPPSFTEHIITTGANGARDVFAIDLDGDNDIDVLAASAFDDTVAWYESNGASPPSFTEHFITQNANFASAVFAIDLDGDTHIDVLSAASIDDKIVWYENDGATPPNFAEHVITTGANGAQDVFAIDLDGDNDIDVLSASSNDDKIAWYENNGANPPSFIEHVITTNANFAISVFAIDLDGDGDVDVVSASFLDDKIAWYENDGTTPPNFAEHIITTAENGTQGVFAIDLDGDSNVDVLSTSGLDNSITWYRNDGAMPPNFTPFLISSNAPFAWAVTGGDVDGDGDIDVLSSSNSADTIAWYEMTEPTFGSCCLSDGSCLDAMCLADCAALLGWAWTPGNTCEQTDCPGVDAPATFLVQNLSLENFTQDIADLAAFKTRYWNLPGNDLAVAYLAEKLESFGYDNIVLDPYLFQGQEKFNVYATKIGATRPLEMYIVGAHLDSFNINGDFGDAPGADDDASGCASVLEMARVFATAQTDVSIRFVFWNNEETGLNGSAAYVANHRDLQGTPQEPTWIAMIQQDMILFDHGPGKIPDADVEFQAANQADGHAAILAAFVAGAMQRYGDMPAEVGDNMDFTDSKSFWNDTAAISVRENQRVSEIGNGSNPHWHQPSDNPDTYTAQDYEFGFNIVKMITGALGELVNASPSSCLWDLDGNNDVGIGDLLILLGAWGPNPGHPADFDGNDDVGVSDLLVMLANWGPCP